MFNTLFRDEAFSSSQRDMLGRVSLRVPRLGWLFFVLGILVVTVAICLLLLGHFTRHERAAGAIVPQGGVLTMTSSQAGVVWRVFVKENQVVKAGQPLMEISVAQIGARTGNAQDSIAGHLVSKIKGLNNDLAAQDDFAKIERDELVSHLKSLRQQLAQIKEQVTIQRQRSIEEQSLYEEWKRVEVTGVVSRAQLLSQHDQALQSLAQVSSLRMQEMDIRHQAQQISESLYRLPIDMSAKRNAVQRQIDDAAREQVENEAHRSILITAPTAGVVTNVLANEGQTLDARQSVLTVLQENAILKAELWVPTSAIGFIREGQSVVLRYHAFPYQSFGEYRGRVSVVSRSAVLPTEVGKITGHTPDQPSYRVEVTLDRQDVNAFGKRQKLKPGMELDADILLKRQSLISWMFEPIHAMLSSTATDQSTVGAMP